MVVRSETKLFARLLWDCIKTPFLFILVLVGRRDSSVLWKPFVSVKEWVVESPCTNWIIVITTLVTFVDWFLLPTTVSTNLANYPTDLLAPTRWYAIFASSLVHVDLSHWFWNMLILFGFGRLVERELGSVRTLQVYAIAILLSGVSDMVFGLLAGNTIGSVGASGGISGLVIVGMLVAPFTIMYESIIPLPAMIAGWMSIAADVSGFLSPMESTTAYAAHIGGYISILAVFWLLHDKRPKLVRGLAIHAGTAVLLIVFWFLL